MCGIYDIYGKYGKCGTRGTRPRNIMCTMCTIDVYHLAGLEKAISCLKRAINTMCTTCTIHLRGYISWRNEGIPEYRKGTGDTMSKWTAKHLALVASEMIMEGEVANRWFTVEDLLQMCSGMILPAPSFVWAYVRSYDRQWNWYPHAITKRTPRRCYVDPQPYDGTLSGSAFVLDRASLDADGVAVRQSDKRSFYSDPGGDDFDSAPLWEPGQ